MAEFGHEGGHEEFIRRYVEQRRLRGWLATTSFRVSRFIIRTLRIAVALVMVVLGLMAGG